MTRLRAGLLALIAVSVTASSALAQSTVPLPRPKPTALMVAIVIAPVPIPVPKPQPPRNKPTLRGTEKPWPMTFGRWPAGEVQEARAHCLAVLSSRDMIWRPDQPIGEPGGCGTPAPIAVAEVSGVRINPPATVNCDFAAALGD
jgi:hypothetical protein